VLVVDDNLPICELMSVMVAQEGYETLKAQNGYEAIRLAETIRVDLLITDVDMPGMTGPELVQTLAERDLIKRARLVTGDVSVIDRLPLDHGHNSVPFLAKPFNSRQLLAKVRSLMSQ